MLKRVMTFFTTQRTKHVLMSSEHLKKRLRLANEERQILINQLAEHKRMVLKFQHLMDKVAVNEQSPYDLKMLKAFGEHSKAYISNSRGEGLVALAHNAIKRYDFDPGELPNYSWRGKVAEVKDGELKFYPEQIDIIEWKDYPSDAHIFIEWIAHHQRIIDRDKGLTRGDGPLTDYCIEFS